MTPHKAFRPRTNQENISRGRLSSQGGICAKCQGIMFKTARPCESAGWRVISTPDLCREHRQFQTVCSLPCRAAPACCGWRTTSDSIQGTRPPLTQCDWSSSQLLLSVPSQPKPEPAKPHGPWLR